METNIDTLFETANKILLFFSFAFIFLIIEQFQNWAVLVNIEFLNKNKYETEKSLSRHCYCHFRYIIALLVIGSRRYETLAVGYGSFRCAAIYYLILKIWLFHDNFPYRNPVSLPQKKRLLPAVMGYGLIFYKNI